MKMQHYLDDARIDSWICCPLGRDLSIKSSWKDVCSIELDEFYLGISFSVFGITYRRIAVGSTKNVWFFADFLSVFQVSLYEKGVLGEN